MLKKLLLSLNDFVSKEIIKISLYCLAATVVIYGVLFFAGAQLLQYLFSQYLVRSLEGGQVEVLASIKEYLSSFAITEFLLQVEFFEVVLDIIIFINLLLFLYLSFLFIYSIVIGFFAPNFVKVVQKRHYPQIRRKSLSLVFMIWTYVKVSLIAGLGIVLFLPLFFVPALNFLLFVPLYYFFHKSLVLDVSSEINDKSEYKRIKKANWFELKFQTLVLFLLSLIPVAGILLMPFYFVFIAHTIFEQTRLLREAKEFKA
ncbi:MAG: EI24 domain-containing protein [Campylobacterota bacterium]